MKTSKSRAFAALKICSMFDSSEASVLLLAHTKRRRSAADRFANGLAYDVDDEAGRSND
jgi:hypothetical protein